MKKFLLLAFFGLAALFVNAQNQQHNNNQGEDVKVVINVEDVNPAITSYVEKNYTGYKIEKAMSLQTNGIPTKYKTTIKKDEEVRILTFDKDFKFISVLDPKKEKRVKTPATTN